ncbi:2245_t:CDS:1 [Paraglomus occultum]|uniref:2245_t:CDS:1 n=1 Tax=Paraglomus occultum TaxID=144539 RepID=A0A9N9E3C7_9GLOM|nr:2245_t:CDS:1 [Paraglomus occultum]
METALIENNQYRSITLSQSSSSSSTSHINNSLSDLQLFPESDNSTLESNIDLSSEIADEPNIQIKDNPDALLYELNKVYNVISLQFGQATEFDEPVKYIFEIELDAELMEIALTIPQLADDRKVIRDKFCEISKFLIWLIKSASGYYWEIRNIHLCRSHKQLTHSANIYLGCTMRDDRAWQ